MKLHRPVVPQQPQQRTLPDRRGMRHNNNNSSNNTTNGRTTVMLALFSIALCLLLPVYLHAWDLRTRRSTLQEQQQKQQALQQPQQKPAVTIEEELPPRLQSNQLHPHDKNNPHNNNNNRDDDDRSAGVVRRGGHLSQATFDGNVIESAVVEEEINSRSNDDATWLWLVQLPQFSAASSPSSPPMEFASSAFPTPDAQTEAIAHFLLHVMQRVDRSPLRSQPQTLRVWIEDSSSARSNVEMSFRSSQQKQESQRVSSSLISVSLLRAPQLTRRFYDQQQQQKSNGRRGSATPPFVVVLPLALVSDAAAQHHHQQQQQGRSANSDNEEVENQKDVPQSNEVFLDELASLLHVSSSSPSHRLRFLQPVALCSADRVLWDGLLMRLHPLAGFSMNLVGTGLAVTLDQPCSASQSRTQRSPRDGDDDDENSQNGERRKGVGHYALGFSWIVSTSVLHDHLLALLRGEDSRNESSHGEITAAAAGDTGEQEQRDDEFDALLAALIPSSTNNSPSVSDAELLQILAVQLSSIAVSSSARARLLPPRSLHIPTTSSSSSSELWSIERWANSNEVQMQLGSHRWTVPHTHDGLGSSPRRQEPLLRPWINTLVSHLFQQTQQLEQNRDVLVEGSAEHRRRVVHDNTLLYWDPFCSCTGLNIEAIQFVLGLEKKMAVRSVTNEDCWCGGFPISDRSALERTRQDISILEREDARRNPSTTEQRKTHREKKVGTKVVWVSHKPIDFFPTFPYKGALHEELATRPDRVIGRTMTEGDRLSFNEVQQLKKNLVDEVWVPAPFLVDVLYRSGVPTTVPVYVIPEGIDTNLYDPARYFDLRPPHPQSVFSSSSSASFSSLPSAATTNGERVYRFLANFKWEDRKGWQFLLAAYFREFTANSPVCLTLKTYLYGVPGPMSRNRDLIRDKIVTFAQTLGLRDRSLLPCLEIETAERSASEMPQLYREHDALLLPTRGEGWGLPVLEAMAMALPVIATNWSGPPAMIQHEQTGFLISVLGMEEVNAPWRETLDEENNDGGRQPSLLFPLERSSSSDEIPYGGRGRSQPWNQAAEPTLRGPRWARPDQSHLQRLMKQLVEDRALGLRVGTQAREFVVKRLQRDVVAGYVTKRLEDSLWE